MAKDPAFLFYSSDFLTGTMMMTDCEVGQYIRLLCYQHQAGHFDATAMQRLCGGNPSASLSAKFIKDSNGLFFNERLEAEVIKRKAHSEKQRDNANKRWQSNGNATAMPLEDENENVIEKEIKRENKNKNGSPRKFEGEVNEIVAELNTLASRSFIPTSKVCYSHISARLKEGHTVDDLKKVVQLKVYAWNNDPKMKEYLRPQTLFSLENFEGYLTDVKDHIRNGTKPSTGRPTNGVKSKDELKEEIRIYKLQKQANQ